MLTSRKNIREATRIGKIDISKLGTNVGDELRTTPLDQEKYDAQKKI